MPAARLSFQPGVGRLFMSRFVRQVRRIICLSSLLYCAGAWAAPAQQFRGSLRGLVQDASGAAVPSAKIVAQAADSSFQREVLSDDRGGFRIEDLLPGTYRLAVNAKGFAEARSDVKVVVGSVREITVRLKLESIVQSVTLD